jgi:hypothetical protein
VSVNDPDAINRYFSNGKLIIVDRDPRDMYVDDIVNWSGALSDDMSSDVMGKKYVDKHIAMRKNIREDQNVMYLRFEDLVLDYERTVERIADFLEFKLEDHIKKRTFLIPERSSKNVGIWKKHYSEFKDAIDVIENELKDFCYMCGQE